MKKYVLILILTFTTFVAMAQLSVSYSVGYGTFQLGDMQGMMERRLAVVNKFFGDARVTDNFANDLMHSLEVDYSLGKEEYGFQITYTKSVAEIAHRGESDTYMEKASLSSIRFGTMFRYYFWELPLGKSRKISLFGDISPGGTVSSLKHKGMGVTGELGGTEGDMGGSTFTLSIMPGVGAKMAINKKFGLRINAGYDLSLSGKIEKADETSVGWSGVRSNVSVYYVF